MSGTGGRGRADRTGRDTWRPVHGGTTPVYLPPPWSSPDATTNNTRHSAVSMYIKGTMLAAPPVRVGAERGPVLWTFIWEVGVHLHVNMHYSTCNNGGPFTLCIPNHNALMLQHTPLSIVYVNKVIKWIHCYKTHSVLHRNYYM